MSTTGSSWVGPYWLERQRDPDSPDFVSGSIVGPGVVADGPEEADRSAFPGNRTRRRVTTIGTLATGARAAVDERGLVTPSAGGWSLDWWVRAEDQWHLPSRSRTVRQRLIGAAPVVETAMRVPGGDIVQRAAAFLDSARGSCVLIEIENRSAVPVAVALSVRPYDIDGHRVVRRVAVSAGGIAVDDRPAVLLPRPPADIVFGDARGDGAARLFAEGPMTPASAAFALGGGDGEGGGDGVAAVMVGDDAEGWANAAVVFPLAHTAVLRVVLPLDERVAARRGRRRGQVATDDSVRSPAATPTGEQVAKGWDVQLRRGLSIDLPVDKLAAAIVAAEAQLLLTHAGDDLVAWGSDLGINEMAELVRTLDVYGFHDEAAQVLRTWPERQTLDGAFGAGRDRYDAAGAALGAVAHHWRLTRDDDLVASMIGPLAKSAYWIESKRTARRAARDPRACGLLPEGDAPGAFGGRGVYLRDAAIAARGLLDIAEAEDAIGQPEVAADARRFAASLIRDLDATLARLGVDRADGSAMIPPIPATPSRGLDGGELASLDLVTPVGVLGASDPRMSATIDHIRDHLLVGPAVFRAVDGAGLTPSSTLRLALVELDLGDLRALDRLDWAVDAGGPTTCWPSVIHPRTGSGSGGRPHDPVVNARFLTLVRRVLVHEIDHEGVPGLALCGLMSPAWLGQPVDVRGAPTAFGRLSFAIRWHGDRPALLWELNRHADAEMAPIVISAPGLDPSWRTTESKGEALLAPVAAPEVLVLTDPETGRPTDLGSDLPDRSDHPGPRAASPVAFPATRSTATQAPDTMLGTEPVPDAGESFT